MIDNLAILNVREVTKHREELRDTGDWIVVVTLIVTMISVIGCFIIFVWKLGVISNEF